MYRQAIRHDENIGELRRRTDPKQMTRDLSGDARRRAVMSGSNRIEELRAEARYHRDRYRLYRAKIYGGRARSMARLRALERAHQGAEARLRRAQQERASDNRD